MELKDFIRYTLTDIKKGVENAGKEGVKVSGSTAKIVEFDISVTINNSDESKIGGGIFIAGLGIGSNQKEANSNSAISKIKFSLPLFLE